MTKPTPSPLPWVLFNEDWVYDSDGHTITSLGHERIGISPEERQANPKLIVQSVNRSGLFDEMLKELKAVHSNLINHGDKKTCRMCKLIARAQEANRE